MPSDRRVHAGSGWFIQARLVVVGFIQVRVGSLGRDRVRFIRVRPACLLVHSCSLGSYGCAMGVVGFIRVRSGTPWGWSGLLGFVGFIRARRRIHRWVRWVQSGALGSFGQVQVVIGLIPVRWIHLGAGPGGRMVHSHALLGSSVSFGFVGFKRARPRCSVFIRAHPACRRVR